MKNKKKNRIIKYVSSYIFFPTKAEIITKEENQRKSVNTYLFEVPE